MKRFLVTFMGLSYISFALPEGKVLFENHCLRCHAPGSPKPVEFLRSKYRSNAEGVLKLAKRCPWGRGLSDMEIRAIAEWLSGKK
ncbi:c-type cytochrome [Hydrogenivirga sp.]